MTPPPETDQPDVLPDIANQDRRDVAKWLTEQADQRIKFFPQDGIDSLMRHLAQVALLALHVDRSAGRWCALCSQHGSHHTDRHNDFTSTDAREALAELVRLKDGPRGAAYDRQKPVAWTAARAALATTAPDAGQRDGQDRATHPMQPVVMVNGVKRFRANAIVEHLLEHGGIDMNALARLDFTDEDRAQFAQLIGYSVSGFGDLPYADDETAARADREAGDEQERA